MFKHLPGNNVEAEQDRLIFVFSQSVFYVSVKWHIVVTVLCNLAADSFKKMSLGRIIS